MLPLLSVAQKGTGTVSYCDDYDDDDEIEREQQQMILDHLHRQGYRSARFLLSAQDEEEQMERIRAYLEHNGWHHDYACYADSADLFRRHLPPALYDELRCTGGIEVTLKALPAMYEDGSTRLLKEGRTERWEVALGVPCYLCDSDDRNATIGEYCLVPVDDSWFFSEEGDDSEDAQRFLARYLWLTQGYKTFRARALPI